ncbi:pyridoxal 5'-phosphate synthase [Niabella pedocola]|uniref:Pyridoxal 5'-phosphate synthase n=1 Tax=Niabella pedocola TaxID=1752077 RepID=A0ABS8PN90_9BACT|nr:pyridoxal 5'-phosphate synthase [Niabella pedocola]MCD2422209.1 pyridoxal 5'-phosphate synthase [Niabella pedocola]
MNPLELFDRWYQEENMVSGATLPGACCLTTRGLDGFPNGRFVSLKEVKEGSFIITGPTNARKGQEIAADNKVGLTFWWPVTGRQVRIQGIATPVSAEAADRYFAERDEAARVVSVMCTQGTPVDDYDQMVARFQQVLEEGAVGKERPENWGGYAIAPVRIELMIFSATRLHDRNYFEMRDGRWVHQKLQP